MARCERHGTGPAPPCAPHCHHTFDPLALTYTVGCFSSTSGPGARARRWQARLTVALTTPIAPGHGWTPWQCPHPRPPLQATHPVHGHHAVPRGANPLLPMPTCPHAPTPPCGASPRAPAPLYAGQDEYPDVNIFPQDPWLKAKARVDLPSSTPPPPKPPYVQRGSPSSVCLGVHPLALPSSKCIPTGGYAGGNPQLLHPTAPKPVDAQGPLPHQQPAPAPPPYATPQGHSTPHSRPALLSGCSPVTTPPTTSMP
jgi:hypothetical protein